MQVKEQVCTRSNEGSKQRKLCPPTVGHYNVNVDVVVLKDQQIAGLSAVIRDSQGQVIAAAVKSTMFQENVSTAEAIKWGMEVAKEARLTAIIVEMDCNEVVDLAANKTVAERRSFGLFQKFKEAKETFNR